MLSEVGCRLTTFCTTRSRMNPLGLAFLCLVCIFGGKWLRRQHKSVIHVFTSTRVVWELKLHSIWNFQLHNFRFSVWDPVRDSEGLPDSLVGKESACDAGDPRLIPGYGISAGEGIGYPLQCSSLENPMDCIVHGIAKSQTRLSDFHFHFQ